MTARILVVDDTEPNRRLAQANLLAAGYDVTLAESGAEALARFRERTPDLVLLDILMPGMDGFETCRRLRALPAGGGTPIVFLTALGDLGTHEQAMASGADDFLTKPIRRTELLIRVRSLVHMARLQRQRDHLMDFIVHDLKGPLANILANTQYLKQKLDAQGDDALAFDDMVSGVDTMNRMVMDLLDVNRSDEGGLVATRRVVDVEALLSAIRDAAQRRADECGLGLVVASNLGGQALEADEDLLRRVIENLLDNCMKYTPKGGTIAISARVAPDVGGDRFDLRILDSGPGIPDAHKATIFDKYGQLDRDAQTHARVSRGVGLAFCRHAVAAHGGTIAVEDNQPRGSVFVVRLPMKGP